MRLVKTHPCDGSCCRSAPAFPESVGDRDCKYLDSSNPEFGCRVMRGEIELTGDDKDKFERICHGWPDNMPGRATGGCCWQWIDDGN